MKILARSFFGVLTSKKPAPKLFEVPEGTTAQDIIDQMRVDISEGAIILINGKPSNEQTVLSEGDELSIFPPVSAA
ncbi:MAG: MoaD/ThiS family protein [Desulfomonilia bacterium]|jgi:sulfur carrier protein ThiS